MGFFSVNKDSKASAFGGPGMTTKDNIIPSTTDFGGGDFFYPYSVVSSLNWKDRDYLQHYLEVPELASVINKKASAFSKMKIEVVSKATGKPVNNQDTAAKTLRNPNYFQSQKEFLYQTKLFHEIFGNEFLYFFKPAGFTTKISGLFTLPPLFVEIDEPTDRPFFLRSNFADEVQYWISMGNQRTNLDKGEFVHINQAASNIKADNVFWGESRMQSAMVAIQNIRAAYEARNVLIENRGALGILTNNSTDGIGSTLPLDEKEKQKVQDEWKKYGIQKNQFQAIITSLNLKWQQISTDANKLQLFEETKADQEQLCDAYGVPFELFANQKGVTFDNKKQARREFYENTIIPEAEEWIDALNRYFETYNKSWEIKGSFDHLSVFQENQKERAQSITLLTNALSKAFQDGALSLDQYKAELRKLRIGENG